MVQAEILDKETGCTYIKKGTSIEDCVKQFQDMFFKRKTYTILWQEEVKNNG